MRASSNRITLICEKMNRTARVAFHTVLLLSASSFFSKFAVAKNDSTSAPSKCPPAAHIDSAKDTYGATIVADAYRWLEDQNSAETRAWIDAQQKCTQAALSNLPSRAEINKRLGELLPTDSFEIPIKRGGR